MQCKAAPMPYLGSPWCPYNSHRPALLPHVPTMASQSVSLMHYLSYCMQHYLPLSILHLYALLILLYTTLFKVSCIFMHYFYLLCSSHCCGFYQSFATYFSWNGGGCSRSRASCCSHALFSVMWINVIIYIYIYIYYYVDACALIRFLEA